MPDFNAKIIDEVGHRVMIDVPDKFNDLLVEIIDGFRQ